MIIIDPRVGSRELFGELSTNGVPIRMSPDELPAGDFIFEGNGPSGRIFIGIERKAVNDMLNCISYGRLSGGQLPLLIPMYDRQYLIIEGIYRCGTDKLLEGLRGNKWVPIQLGNRRFMFSQLEHYLTTLSEMTTVQVIRTSDYKQTAQHILALWHWWNDKQYDQHSSLDVKKATHVEFLGKWSDARRVAVDLPGIGQKASKAVENHFGTIFRMAQASEEEWSRVLIPTGDKTRKLGKVAAKRIYEAIRGQV